MNAGSSSGSGRRPVQKRSRERLEKILLAAADELAKVSRAEDLTTTSVSRRAGVPVSTLYRYFTDRSDIIAALVDQEMLWLDARVRESLQAAERMDIEKLLRTILFTHFEHFRNERRAVIGWFGARQSKSILERADHRYKHLGDWVVRGSVNAGFVDRPVPEWAGEAIFWLCDRSFEFVFREERSRDAQDAIVEETVQILLGRFRDYSSADELIEVDAETFWDAFGPYDPPIWEG